MFKKFRSYAQIRLLSTYPCRVGDRCWHEIVCWWPCLQTSGINALSGATVFVNCCCVVLRAAFSIRPFICGAVPYEWSACCFKVLVGRYGQTSLLSSLLDDAPASWTGWPWELDIFSSSSLFFLLLFHFLNKARAEVNLGVSLNWVAESLDIGGGFCSEGVHRKHKYVIHGNICSLAVNHSKYNMAADALLYDSCSAARSPPTLFKTIITMTGIAHVIN